jgi:CHAT domain-containing protein
VLEAGIPSDDLAVRVRLARELLGRRETAAQSYAALGALHNVLIQPALRAGALDGARRLIVVPHSVLSYLPFSALRDATAGRFLVERYVLVHLPSAAALPAQRYSARTGRSDRETGGRGSVFAPFPRALPATTAEADAVRRAVPRSTAYVADRATERMLRRALTGGGIVHVATHAVMNARNPMFSGVELARGPSGTPDDNGRLEVHELLALTVSSPLVVLSGCETGVGSAWSTQFDRGEDYATLAQAFLYAGTRSVVATLWRIEDDGAAAFAKRLYQHLRHSPPAEALARAQLETMRDARHAAPFYWAAYQLSGD